MRYVPHADSQVYHTEHQCTTVAAIMGAAYAWTDLVSPRKVMLCYVVALLYVLRKVEC
jgi:hypothetical protein